MNNLKTTSLAIVAAAMVATALVASTFATDRVYTNTRRHRYRHHSSDKSCSNGSICLSELNQLETASGS